VRVLSAVLWPSVHGLTSGLLAGSMSDGLSLAGWIALCRAAMVERRLTTREVDSLVQERLMTSERWGDGYMAKLMCGQVKAPRWSTIERVSKVLGIRLYALRGSDALDGVGGNAK